MSNQPTKSYICHFLSLLISIFISLFNISCGGPTTSPYRFPVTEDIQEARDAEARAEARTERLRNVILFQASPPSPALKALLDTIQDESKTKDDIEKLITKENINITYGRYGLTPLHHAIGLKRPDGTPNKERIRLIAQLLVDHGADVNIGNTFGETPLYDAVFDEDLFKILLQARADVNKAANDGRTVLWRAIACKDSSLVDILLKAQADVNKVDKDGRTPLWWSALTTSNDISNNRKIMKLLLDAKADVNKADKDGKTPLWNAVKDERGYMVEMLLAFQADPDQKDVKGQSPRELAEVNNLTDIQSIFNKYPKK